MAEMGLSVVIVSRDVSTEPDLSPYVASGRLVVYRLGEGRFRI